MSEGSSPLFHWRGETVLRLVSEIATQFQAVLRGEQSAAGEDVIE